MTNHTATTPSASQRPASRPAAAQPAIPQPSLLQAIPGWILSVLLALIFLSVGAMKLMSRPNMVQEFAQVGLGQWFRYFTGLLEVAGAICMLVPKLSRWGAVVLAAVMSGAVVAHLTALHSPPTLPAILLVMVLAATWLRRL
jgi:putative oxidoreductase